MIYRLLRPGAVLPAVAAIAALVTIGLAPPSRTVALAIFGGAIVASGELGHRIHVWRGWRGRVEDESATPEPPVSRASSSLLPLPLLEAIAALSYGAGAGVGAYVLVVLTTTIAPGGALFVLVGGAAAVGATALLAGSAGRSSES